MQIMLNSQIYNLMYCLGSWFKDEMVSDCFRNIRYCSCSFISAIAAGPDMTLALRALLCWNVVIVLDMTFPTPCGCQLLKAGCLMETPCTVKLADPSFSLCSVKVRTVLSRSASDVGASRRGVGWSGSFCLGFDLLVLVYQATMANNSAAMLTAMPPAFQGPRGLLTG